MKSIKSIGELFLAAGTAIYMIYFLCAFCLPHKSPPKEYTVSHTQEAWQSELDTLRMFQQVVGYQMSRQEAEQWQVIVIRMQQRITSQVAPQIQEEQRKEAAKKDSSTKKQK